MPLPDPAALGFSGNEAEGWLRTLKDRLIHFRLLRTLPDLTHAEWLQEAVYGIGERDLVSASELIVVPETGGAVLGAFAAADPDRPLGGLVGWGGYVERPRIVSDFLAVRPDARNLGLAAELKRLQAAIALGRGFQEIVWTVDPLLAANARLNFGKLGATARHYEIDRYGAGFATGRYGGVPSDRLHLTWEIASPRVIALLLGDRSASESSPTSDVRPYTLGTTADHTLVAIPANADALLAADHAAALAWRMRLRESLTQAFTEGFAITGFRPAGESGEPAYELQRLD